MYTHTYYTHLTSRSVHSHQQFSYFLKLQWSTEMGKYRNYHGIIYRTKTDTTNSVLIVSEKVICASLFGQYFLSYFYVTYFSNFLNFGGVIF